MKIRQLALLSMSGLAAGGAFVPPASVNADPAEECREGCDVEEGEETRDVEVEAEREIREQNEVAREEASEC